MIRKFAFAAALLWASAASTLATAQTSAPKPAKETAKETAKGSSADPSGAAAAAPKAVTPKDLPPLGLIGEEASGAATLSDRCEKEGAKNLPPKAGVIVVRIHDCTSIYGDRYSKSYYEVLLGGKPYFVDKSGVDILAASREKFDNTTSEEVQANMEEWKAISRALLDQEVSKARAALVATSKAGIAILDTGVYDVSDYTEGTGFRVTVFNTSKKRIKYVTFTLQGFNAVNDVVKDRLKNTSLPVFQGIGPIEPGEIADYSKDYMWHTDLVDSFRIKQLKIEFMDGTSKVINDVAPLRISPTHRALLSADLD